MSVIGIICEFNPFHNGHKYLIDSVKKDGDTVVCVMSGNFVQRGESAITDKRIRAKAALLCGADLECGATEKLKKAAEAIENKDVHNEIYRLMQTGITFAVPSAMLLPAAT